MQLMQRSRAKIYLKTERDSHRGGGRMETPEFRKLFREIHCKPVPSLTHPVTVRRPRRPQRQGALKVKMGELRKSRAQRCPPH